MNRYIVKQFFTDLFINGIVMSFFTPPLFRRFLLKVYTRGGVSGYIAPHTIITSPKLYVGNHSFINRRCLIDNGDAMITIQEDCAIGCDVKLLTTNHDYTNMYRRAGRVISKAITIERGCWIGAGATLLPGTIIREGSVIAAGSVVRGEIPRNSLYAGIPAKRIKGLNEEDNRKIKVG